MKHVYVVGDSISIHYGPYLEQYLHGFMQYSRKTVEEEALLNLDNPQGANGGDSSMVLSFLQAASYKGSISADILLINCGLHDIKMSTKTKQKQVSIESYRKNLQAILSIVKKMNIDLAWIRTTPCDENIHNHPGMTFYRFAIDCETYNNVADDIMHANNIPIIDLFTFTKNLAKDVYCDHVHFHNHIRMKQAAFVAGWLVNWVNKCTVQ